MNLNNRTVRPKLYRLFSVWYRHMRVYTSHLISNGLPPFLEPLLFLAGIGLGLKSHIPELGGIPFVSFLASGLLMTSAMFTASFECTYGTFIRLEFDHVYDGMLGTPITAHDLIIGELLWAGATKGFFFSSCVLFVVSITGSIPVGWSLLTPFIGMLTGLMFGGLSLVITSFVGNMNHFNFYFTGFLTPMFYFSGVIFPIADLPKVIQPLALVFPLTHSVNLARGLCFGKYTISPIFSLIYIITFIVVFSILAVYRLKKKVID